MNITEFKLQLEQNYHKYFTNSKITIEKDCFGDNYYITSYIANNLDEVHFGILRNDILSVSFYICGLDNKKLAKLEELPDKIELQIHSKCYKMKPQNKYHALSFGYFNFRKQNGSVEKILNTLDRYFKIIRSRLKEELKNNCILDDDVQLLTSKLI